MNDELFSPLYRATGRLAVFRPGDTRWRVVFDPPWATSYVSITTQQPGEAVVLPEFFTVLPDDDNVVDD